MTKANGFRSRTRKLLRKKIRKHGMPSATSYLRKYKIGDYVVIKIDSAVHQMMPHRKYHGRIARIYTVYPRFVGVVFHYRERGVYKVKTLFVRPQHLVPFNGRDKHIERIKANKKIYEEAIEKKIQPEYDIGAVEGPREEFVITKENNKPIEVGYKPIVKLF